MHQFMNIYVKWFLVVALNSILGFLIGYKDGNTAYLVGMITGVFTWYFIYLFIDRYLQKKGRLDVGRKLLLSALLRVPLQLTTVPDVFAGIAAMATVEYLGLNPKGIGFIHSYSITIFTGLYLSVMCSVIYLIITGAGRILRRK